jgi:hypothetical protein
MTDIYLMLGGAATVIVAVYLCYCNTSRLYRRAIQDGVLVNQRRSVLLPWRWVYNDSEENHLNVMKNELTFAREKAKLLSRRIPQEEAALKKKKDKLQENSGSVGQPYRDKWRPRRAQVRLQEDIKLARSKKKRDHIPRKGVIAELKVPN